MDELRETLRDDDALADAARRVLDSAESGDGVVTWGDVSGDVPAEQWGRLLESELLVSAGSGFVVDDPDAIRAALEALDVDADAPDEGEESDADGDWSRSDKVAGVCALGLLASYQVPVAKETIGSTAHLLFGPVEAALPFGLTVALLAVATTLVSTTLRKRLTDGTQREQLQDRLQQVNERLQAARDRGDDDAVERLQTRRRELMGEQLGAMKGMLRPMVYTMLVTIPIFLWLSWLTVNPAAAITPAAQMLPFMGRVVWTARLVGPMQVWMVWYFACNVLATVVGKRAVRRARPALAKYRSVV
jgi:uncharacterized membrane protein (DUF106 family)